MISFIVVFLLNCLQTFPPQRNSLFFHAQLNEQGFVLFLISYLFKMMMSKKYSDFQRISAYSKNRLLCL